MAATNGGKLAQRAGKTKVSASVRERLLSAAHSLFYDEGIHTVGIDRVIDEAGVAKASLYSTFGSKEELVTAYLSERDRARKLRIEKAIAAHSAPVDQILAIYEMLGDLFVQQGFRGCAFIRASAEEKPGTPVRKVCDDSRAWVRSVFEQLASRSGARHPELLAQQLVLLYDGAAVGSQMDQGLEAARAARAAAATLLESAIPS